MSCVSDCIKLYNIVRESIKHRQYKKESDESAKRAIHYYEKGIHNLALSLSDSAIERNKSINDNTCFELHLRKGDIFTEKGMHLFQKNVDGKVLFEKAIDEFNSCIHINPFDPVSWLGKGFAHIMLGLIDETQADYHFYEAIFSLDAGLGTLEESGPNKEIESNLWALKGGVFYMIEEDEEGDKCFKMSGFDSKPKEQNP